MRKSVRNFVDVVYYDWLSPLSWVRWLRPEKKVGGAVQERIHTLNFRLERAERHFKREEEAFLTLAEEQKGKEQFRDGYEEAVQDKLRSIKERSLRFGQTVQEICSELASAETEGEIVGVVKRLGRELREYQKPTEAEEFEWLELGDIWILDEYREVARLRDSARALVEDGESCTRPSARRLEEIRTQIDELRAERDMLQQFTERYRERDIVLIGEAGHPPLPQLTPTIETPPFTFSSSPPMPISLRNPYSLRSLTDSDINAPATYGPSQAPATYGPPSQAPATYGAPSAPPPEEDEDAI